MCFEILVFDCGKIFVLVENTSLNVVFNELLVIVGRDIVIKDIFRLRGGWLM